MAKSRFYFLSLAFLILFLLVWLRLFQIQVIDHQKFDSLAKSQHWKSLEIPARRGRILSEDGFTLVDNQASYLLYAHPKKVVNERIVASELAQILFDEEKFSQKEKSLGRGNLKIKLAGSLEKKLSNKDLFWVSLYHKLNASQKGKIESLGFEGLGFEAEPERFYPEGSLAAFVLGFVGSDSLGREKGYYGLEGYYDGDLKGRPGKVMEEQSAGGIPILLGGYQKIPSADGRDLHLTLNRSVQFIAETKIKAGVQRYGAKSGTVIVMDPFSGAVIAMAAYPTFDPASWSQMARQMSEAEGTEDSSVEDNLRLSSFRNPAISETFEPGSVLKALTLSAGIAAGAVSPQSTFNDAGPIMASGFRVDNWDRKHHGQQTMVEVLQKSNNMGAAFVGRKIGAATLREYFLKFGLGSRLGIDLEGEDSGVVKSYSDFREIDLVTNSFGQGISLTPLQLAAAFTAIANGGTLYKPHLVRKITEDAGEIVFGKEVIRQVLTAQKSKVMVEMLTAAAEGGEAKFFVLKKYRVAGKTGTAQIPLAGGYDPNQTNATFVGFLPGSLKFVMLVKLSQPTSSIYAAETAVPLWMEITKDLVTYWGIPPDR